MYRPIQDGIEKTALSVSYAEAKPPSHLSGFVHCFWELKTDVPLPADFLFHALPDACVNILFNQIDTQIAGITALHTEFTVLNLGKSFHYVGIELLPGVWQGNPAEISDRYVGTPYEGSLPLVATNQALSKSNFLDQQLVFCKLTEQLVQENIIVPNLVTEQILEHLDSIYSVIDMAGLVSLSPRQLQRVLKKTTGFLPHDLLKVLRLQQSFRRHYLDTYAGQSHYIHSFRKMTGYTPDQYFRKFDV